MVKTIIFDLGGVLVHLDWDGLCAPLATLSGWGADSVRAEAYGGAIVFEFMRGSIGPQEFHEAFCNKLGIVVSYDDFAGIWCALIGTKASIIPLVERLRPGHRLVVASNTDQIHFAYTLQHVDVMRHFDRYFLSYEMGLLKPDPAFFRQVLQDLDTPPADCIFIDDRPENVESARGVGITALLFEGIGRLQIDLDGAL